jgi:hypothetical protein
MATRSTARRGDVSFDQWWDRCLVLDAELEAMATDETLPEGPDRGRIEPWIISTHLQAWA